MGRRKRRRKIIVRKRTLPKVFLCPNCGTQSVMVRITSGPSGRVAHVTCGRCGLSAEVPVRAVDKEVDAYCRFVDMFYAGAVQVS